MSKGQYTIGHKSTVYIIVAVFVIGAVFFAVAGMFDNYQDAQLFCLDNAVNQVMLQKVLYAQECFIYYDNDIDRAIPGTIDLNKFTQQNFDACFQYITKKASLEIKKGDDSVQTIGEEILAPVVVKKPILLYESGEITPATLEFTFVEPAC